MLSPQQRWRRLPPPSAPPHPDAALSTPARPVGPSGGRRKQRHPSAGDGLSQRLQAAALCRHGSLCGGGAGASTAVWPEGQGPLRLLARGTRSPSGDLCGICPQPRCHVVSAAGPVPATLAGRTVATGYQWDRPSTAGVQAAVPSPFLLLSSRERFPALPTAATWPLGISGPGGSRLLPVLCSCPSLTLRPWPSASWS